MSAAKGSDFSPPTLRPKVLLCSSLFFSNLGDRLWQFFVPVFLTLIYPHSITPATLFSLFERLSVFLLGSLFGSLYDKTRKSRLLFLTVVLIFQNVCVIGALMLLYIWRTLPFYAWTWYLILGLLYLVGAIGALCSSLSRVIVARDWIVHVARGPNQRRHLSILNAVIRGVDMGCAVGAPLLISLILSGVKVGITALIVAAWNAASFFCEWGLLVGVYYCTPTLQIRAKEEFEKSLEANEQELQDMATEAGAMEGRGTPESDLAEAPTTGTGQAMNQERLDPPTRTQMPSKHTLPPSPSHTDSAEDAPSVHPSEDDEPLLVSEEAVSTLPCGPLGRYLSSFALYFRQPVWPVSLALSMLYMTALSPHTSMLTSWLILKHIQPVAIAIYQAVSSVFGLLGSVFSPCVIARLALTKSAWLGSFLQWLCLVPGVVFLTLSTRSAQLGWSHETTTVIIYVFLGTITLSRFGLWLFDLSESQIMQGALDPAVRGRVNGVEQSFNAAGSIGIMLVGVAASKPEWFLVPVWVSMTMVTLSWAFLSLWLLLSWLARRRHGGGKGTRADIDKADRVGDRKQADNPIGDGQAEQGHVES